MEMKNNEQIFLKLLYEKQQMTRKEIQAITNLNITSIQYGLTSLRYRNLVVQSASEKGKTLLYSLTKEGKQLVTTWRKIEDIQ